MKKLLFIFAVLGLTLISCKKDNPAPKSESTTQGEWTVGGEDTGDTGGVVSPRDTFLIKSDIKYGLINSIVLIKAEYNDGVLEDEYRLTIDIEDIIKMYDSPIAEEFEREYNDSTSIEIISYWWGDSYEFSGGDIGGIKIDENSENFEQTEYYVEIHLNDANTPTPNNINNNFFKIHNGKPNFIGNDITDSVINGKKVITFKGGS